MPKVATTFGRILGPLGKMPSPQLGIILNTDDKTINELKRKNKFQHKNKNKRCKYQNCNRKTKHERRGYY